jgi:hypothetical protein
MQSSFAAAGMRDPAKNILTRRANHLHNSIIPKSTTRLLLKLGFQRGMFGAAP